MKVKNQNELYEWLDNEFKLLNELRKDIVECKDKISDLEKEEYKHSCIVLALGNVLGYKYE